MWSSHVGLSHATSTGTIATAKRALGAVSHAPWQRRPCRQAYHGKIMPFNVIIFTPCWEFERACCVMRKTVICISRPLFWPLFSLWESSSLYQFLVFMNVHFSLAFSLKFCPLTYLGTRVSCFQIPSNILSRVMVQAWFIKKPNGDNLVLLNSFPFPLEDIRFWVQSGRIFIILNCGEVYFFGVLDWTVNKFRSTKDLGLDWN